MIAIAALFGALALFWLSTRQFALIWRALIWLGGAALLAWIAWLSYTAPNPFGLWHAVSESITRSNDWRDSAIVRALSLNTELVARFFWQLLDFFVLAAAALGLLSLTAFTKGERLEQALRPAILALLAFIAGCAATLAVVAIGFGGYARPRAFTVQAANVNIHDGDTFRAGEYSLRLYGIDAPELNQVCLGGSDRTCGESSKNALETLLANGAHCDQMLSRSGRPRDGLGRALVRCWTAGSSGEQLDVGEEMVRQGHAVQYEGQNYGYGLAEAEAIAGPRGIWATCTLRPDAWRDKEARESFLAGRSSSEGLRIGQCANPVEPAP
ncbi:MAG: thermonuclease family protein [Terricaulis sp.]